MQTKYCLYMSNVNNWAFAKQLDWYKANEIDRLQNQIDEAKKILDDTTYKWRDAEQRKSADIRFAQMTKRLEGLTKFHQEGMTLVKQHETLVNQLSKWYDIWYKNISNDGKQETEIMSTQADMLQQIFEEIYKELLPLKLDIKPPSPLNLK